jgi:hypothetical protein
LSVGREVILNCSGSGLRKSPIARQHGCLGAGSHAKLPEDSRQRVANRLLADEQGGTDFGVVLTRYDRREDLAFPR